MVSNTIKEEWKIANERIRMTLVILIFWVVLTILGISGTINLNTNYDYFLVYAIMSPSAIVILLLGMGIQIEPLLKVIIKGRKTKENVWALEEKLQPSIEKRTKRSEIFQLLAILLLLISLIFVSI